MQRFPRLLVSFPLLATSACAADAIAGPGPAELAPVAPAGAKSKIQAVKAAAPTPAASPPVTILYCRATLSPAATEPLYIIDGVITSHGDALARRDANAMASIQVMKGPEAAALYGSRAAAGVIIVTTRAARP